MIALDGIYPQTYNVLPLFVVLLFEIVVVGLELGVFHGLWKREFNKATIWIRESDKKGMILEEDGYFMGIIAIIVGNVLTFLVGYFIYTIAGGVL